MARQGEPGVADESTTIHLKKHISIATWLDVLGVPEYTKAFQKFSGVQVHEASLANGRTALHAIWHSPLNSPTRVVARIAEFYKLRSV